MSVWILFLAFILLVDGWTRSCREAKCNGFSGCNKNELCCGWTKSYCCLQDGLNACCSQPVPGIQTCENCEEPPSEKCTSCKPFTQYSGPYCDIPPLCGFPPGVDCSFYPKCLTNGCSSMAIFGETICTKFKQLENDLSLGGKVWSSKKTKCIQTKLATDILRIEGNNYSCVSMKNAWFDAHPPCYAKPEERSTWCDIHVNDWGKIVWFTKEFWVTWDFLRMIEDRAQELKKCGVRLWNAALVPKKIGTKYDGLWVKLQETVGDNARSLGWDAGLVPSPVAEDFLFFLGFKAQKITATIDATVVAHWIIEVVKPLSIFELITIGNITFPIN